MSDNTEFSPFTVQLENILEAWEMTAFIGYGDYYEENASTLLQKVNSIEQKINQIIKTKADML